MKYYSRSPEELKEFLKAKKSTHPFKNRTFLIIFADVVLIIAIATLVQKSGYFSYDKISSKGRYARAGMEFSGTIVNLHKAGAGEEIFFFIKLTNNGNSAVDFPAENGPLQIGNGAIEVLENNQIIKSFKIYFEKKTISPEKEVYYKFPLSLHGQLEKKPESYQYQIRLPLEDGEILMHFPSK